MRIDAVELRRVVLRLAAPLQTARGTHTTIEKLLVHVRADDADGWGEVGTDETSHRAGEALDAAEAYLRRELLADLLGRARVSAGDVAAREVPPSPAAQSAKAALETAVLDAELRTASQSLAAWLGVERRRVPAGVVVGIASAPAELLDEVGHRLDQGYRRVKLKIEPGWDVEAVAAVRERFGDIPLQVDGNGSYTRDDTDHLGALDGFDLLMIEQPLPAGDLSGHRELATRLRTPISLDESITSVETAALALERGWCSIMMVKPARLGGLAAAHRLHDLCRERDVPAWLGGMLETGVGRAANVALAALPGFTLPGDLSASDRYWKRDLTRPFELDGDGCLAVPRGPGIGVEPVVDVLDAATVSREVLTSFP